MPADPPRLDNVVAAVVAALSTDLGSGLDLSSGGRVLRGRYTEPPSVALPCAAVAGYSGTGRRGHSLSSWTYTGGVEIHLWAAPTELSTEARVLRGEELLDAAVFALTQAADVVGNPLRTLPDLEFDLEVAEDLEGGGDAAHAVVRLRWTLHRQQARGLSR